MTPEITRREFSTALLGATAPLLFASAGAWAQGTPVEGQHFVRLAQTVPTSVAAGKLEVIEFFWYGCPHCAGFDPAVEVWRRYLPADVMFRRVPVAFRAEPFGMHQRLFYALTNLDLLEALHRKVFNAIHADRLPLNTVDEISAFMVKNGVPAAQFMSAFNSAATLNQQRAANQVVARYKIDGVPAMGVQGRYYTSGALVGAPDRVLDVVDWLLKQVRSSKK
jgi:protein dithiol oxidoreductase (disulfide-forming)